MRHSTLLAFFMAVVLFHWAEHLLQIGQIYLLGWPKKDALGFLGLFFPVLVSSEWLHAVYNGLLLVGIIGLLYGFTGPARSWWLGAMWLQLWHGFEHLLLFVQAQTGLRFFGTTDPQSLIQALLLPMGLRPELHLAYNLLVTVPLVFGTFYYYKWAGVHPGAGRAARGESRSLDRQ